jgi:exodeoxyribonuclease III
MRVVSLNCNGIRSAHDKGFLAWTRRNKVDVLCMQEIKAQEADLISDLLTPRGFHAEFFPAQKKGYAGTAIYSKAKPKAVRKGFGAAEFDEQGRLIEFDFGDVAIASLYVPSGSASEEAQARKFRFMDVFVPELERLMNRSKANSGAKSGAKSSAKATKQTILCGDWNIAHKEIDLKNWRSNQKNSGFLPEERQWLTNLFEMGWVDVFRTLNPLPDQYTWWSARGQAWDNNVGWRLDYQIATADIASTANYTRIYKDARFSDHAPLIIDYDYSLSHESHA